MDECVKEWIFSNNEIINHNFKAISNKINRNLMPTVNAFHRFMTNQKHKNQKVALFMIGVSVYIYCNEKRYRKQEVELEKLRKEMNNMKGE